MAKKAMPIGAVMAREAGTRALLDSFAVGNPDDLLCLRDLLAGKLAALHGDAETPPEALTDGGWKSRLAAFQLAQGLKPDGLAGPTTFMQLNRAIGLDEPRLVAEPKTY